MAKGRGKGGDGGGGWGLFWGLVGLGALAYVAFGRGPENNSALLPDSIENQLDRVVAELNRRYGHQWVDVGLNVLQAYLQNSLPSLLVRAVFEVEQQSRQQQLLGRPALAGPVKRQMAAQRARQLGA